MPIRCFIKYVMPEETLCESLSATLQCIGFGSIRFHSIQLSFYGPLQLAGSREQSYVYALAATALTQSIAKACSSGASAKCSCGPLPNEPPPGEFKWGGCGDDVGFGVIFSKWFTDTPWNKRRTSKRHLVNIHNNAVGRQVSVLYTI